MASRRGNAVRVTSVRRSHAEDLQLRQRRYLLTQAVRVVCVLLAVLLPVATPWKIGFIVASVLLPWLGVVAANGGPVVERHRPAPLRPDVPTPTALPAPEPGRVIEGER